MDPMTVFEACIRGEQLDGRRMTQLAQDAEGPAQLATLAMQYVDPSMQARAAQPIQGMARAILQRWNMSSQKKIPAPGLEPGSVG